MSTPPRSPARRAGWPHSVSTPVATPLQPSVVYRAETPSTLDQQYEGETQGYTYSREGHPNAAVLAGLIDGMEGATRGLVLSSGMAAVTCAMLAALKSGDHVIGGDQLYGRSLRLMGEELPRMGIATSTVDATDANAVAQAIRPETRMILLEVVSNPTIRVADMEGILALARDRGILVAVDNTFTTPAAYRPFDHGADIVIHSVTKLLAGHSDAMLGYVAARDPALQERLEIVAATMGFTASPFDCWMAERGLYTFDLRYQSASANAAALGEALAGMEGVTRVLYPTRSDHPDHNRARALLGDKGGHMLSFEVAGGRAAADALTKAADTIAFAPTLGDINTTLSHPPSSSHRALTAQARQAIGISEGFFRVSVGIEPVDQLIDAFAAGVKAAVNSA